MKCKDTYYSSKDKLFAVRLCFLRLFPVKGSEIEKSISYGIQILRGALLC